MAINKYLEFQKRVISCYIEHPEVKRIWKIIDNKRMYKRLGLEFNSDDTQNHLFVMGKSRVGKSQMMKKYKRVNPNYTIIEEDGTKVLCVPVAYMELPIPFSFAGFYHKIIDSLNAPRTQGSQIKVEFLQNRAFNLLKRQQTEVLIIDELNKLLASTFVNKRQAMEAIKDVSNLTGVCIVCVGTPEIQELRKLSDQFKGRFAPVNIPWFSQCDDKFIKLLNDIEEQLAPEISLGLGDLESGIPELLHELSGGLIGWLNPILREAFNIVGVFDNEFSDFSILDRIDGDILIQARENVIGQLSEEDFNDFIERD